MKRFIAMALVAIALLCHACNQAPESDQKKEMKYANVLISDAPDSAVEDEQQPDDKKKQSVSNPTTSPPSFKDWDRKIIRTANIETEVKDLKLYSSELRTAIRQLGGYVANEQFTSGTYKLSGSLTLKVPVDMFEQAVALVSAKTMSINNINIQSQDVSTEMVDVKARLEVRRSMRERYLQLMQGAKNMEDLLKVQSEVNSLQEEIESGMSRVNYLSHASALSTIHLSCFQVLQTEPEKIEVKDSKIKEAFLTGWEIVGQLFIGLLTIWPLILLTLCVVLLYKTKWRKRQQGSEA